MNSFLASIDRKRLLINAALYLVVLVMYSNGPQAGGALGIAIRIYIWVFPAYYLGYLYFRWLRQQGRDD